MPRSLARLVAALILAVVAVGSVSWPSLDGRRWEAGRPAVSHRMSRSAGALRRLDAAGTEFGRPASGQRPTDGVPAVSELSRWAM
jgi:hypothetical protein